MNREIEFTQPCPVCKKSYQLRTVKPTALAPVFFSFTCDSCDTEMLFRVKLARGHSMGVTVEHSFIRFGARAKILISAAVEMAKKTGVHT